MLDVLSVATGDERLHVTEGASGPSASGARILELIDGASSIGRIVDTLLREYAAPPDIVQSDTLSYVERLLDLGIIRLQATEQPSTLMSKLPTSAPVFVLSLVVASIASCAQATPPCTPKVTRVTFPQDVNSDGTLSGAELPSGTPLKVAVQATCTANTTVKFTEGGAVLGSEVPFDNDAATGSFPAPADGTHDLFAGLVRAGEVVNSPAQNPEAAASITLLRTVNGCANTTRKVQGPSDDADPNASGFQLSATAQVASSVTSVTFTIAGQTPQKAVPVKGVASALFTLKDSGDTTYALTASCADNIGNTALDTRDVRVDYVAPAISLTSPTPSDAGRSLIAVSPFSFTATTDADAVTACISKLNPTKQLGCAAVKGGAVTLPASFGVSSALNLRLRVTDEAGNIGTHDFPADVRLDGCGLETFRPSQCPGIIPGNQVTNGNFAFTTVSDAKCVGATVSLSAAVHEADGGVGAPVPLGTATIGENGTSSIVTQVRNGVTYNFEALVTQADGGKSQLECIATVDLDGPAIQSPAVASADAVATLNADNDSQPSIPGAQWYFQYTARVPEGGFVDVCTTQENDPVTTKARSRANCADGYFLLQSKVRTPMVSFTFPEGTYAIQLALSNGVAVSYSSPVKLFVDVTRPCIRQGSASLPQDTNKDRIVSAAELGSAAPRITAALDPSCGDDGPATLAPNPIAVRNLVGGVVSSTSFTTDSDVSLVGADISATLTQSIAPEADYEFFIEVRDSAGNTNLYAGANDPARLAARIDKVPPSCTIVSPSPTQPLLGRAAVPGGVLSVTVATASDVGNLGIHETLASGTDKRELSLTPSGPGHQAVGTFNLTGTASWTLDVACTDTAGNKATAASTYTVDLDPPICSVVSPKSGSFTTRQLNTVIAISGAEGRTVTCAAGTTPLTPALVAASGVASRVLTYPNGVSTLSCTVADLAGNTCVAQTAGIDVNSTECDLSMPSALTNAFGVWLNRSTVTNLVGSTATARVTAHTGSCGEGKVISLIRTNPTVGTQLSRSTNATGDVVFDAVAVADGEQWSLTIDNGSGEKTTLAFVVAFGQVTTGQATINGVAAASASTLRFVASSDNLHVAKGEAGYFADLYATQPGAQLDLAVPAVAGGRVAGLDGTIELSFAGTRIASLPVTGSPQDFTFAGTTIPHGAQGALTVAVTDAAGNSTNVFSASATSDVIAPAAPSVSQALTSARAATVSLGWDPVFDDGQDSASGGAQGYDLRWTTLSVPGVAADGPKTGSDFFGSLMFAEAAIPWRTEKVSHLLMLPPLNTYFIAVRAYDEVGNYSPFVPPAPVANTWSVVTLTAPAENSFFGATIAAAQLNGDDLDDLVVSAPQQAPSGAVYLYFGAKDLAAQTTCAEDTCQQLSLSDNPQGQFGSDLSASGNLGDVADEKKRDLAVAMLGKNTSELGRVLVYFGSATGKLDPSKAVEIRGETATIGQSARILRDLNGDGLDELAIAAPTLNQNRGRIFIFKGRSQAQWAAAAVATDAASGAKYIPVTAADWAIDGPTPNLASTGNAFGQFRYGLISVPDINGDKVPEVGVPTSRGSINRYRIYSGAAVARSSVAAPLSEAPLWEVSVPTLASSNGVNSGVGASAVTGDVTGNSGEDLILGYPTLTGNGQRLLVFADLVATNTANPTATLHGPPGLGIHASLGQVNSADTALDLLTGTQVNVDSTGWILYQRTSGRGFEGASPTTLGTTPAFWVSRFFGPTITKAAMSSLGKSGTLANFGAGTVVVFGDETNGTVWIWR